MSDLQCPATVIVIPDDVLLERAAADLGAARVALVYCGAGAVPQRVGHAMAQALGVSARALPLAADGSGESDVADGLGPALDDLADEHRGETVVALVPRRLVPAGLGGPLDEGSRGVVVSLDADGRLVRPW